jgi:gas vesicle protein
LNQEFQETIKKRKEETDIRLDELNHRITDLDKYFEEQKTVILKYVDDRGEELTQMLNKFKEEFDEDRRLRLEREEIIVKQLTDHEQEVMEKFEKQIVSHLSIFIVSCSYLSSCLRLLYL